MGISLIGRAIKEAQKSKYTDRLILSSEPGRINISGITYDLVKYFYDFDYNGKVDIKGKGEIDMYFVNKRLDE